MSWHLRSITEVCRNCGKPATQQLHDTFNCPYDYYCDACGVAERDKRNQQDAVFVTKEK